LEKAMSDIRDRLRDGDPLLGDPALPPEDVAAMRRRVLDAVREPRGAAEPWMEWKRTLAIAAALALIAGAGIDTARRAARTENRAAPRILPSAIAAAKTQLHFSTPGGTRIIWTIDPAFQLTEKR
jgi:hypothetical protein